MARPRMVADTAREVLGPLLKGRGYARRSGASWRRKIESGEFTFGIHGGGTGRWNELTGGSFAVEFGGTVLDSFYSAFLQYLPGSARQDWQVRALRVFDRALGRSGDGGQLDDDLVECRQVMLGDVLSGVAAGYLDVFGWPWFDEQDVTGWMEFVARHFATAEAAALADAGRRRDEPAFAPCDAAEMPPPMVVAAREDIAEQLWRYGEDDLAVRMLDADEETWERVMVRAAAPPAELLAQGGGTIDAALVHAAIEVLTGSSRPLARKRRRPQRELPSFWQQVGPERDARPADSPFGLPVARIADLTMPNPGQPDGG